MLNLFWSPVAFVDFGAVRPVAAIASAVTTSRATRYALDGHDARQVLTAEANLRLVRPAGSRRRVFRWPAAAGAL